MKTAHKLKKHFIPCYFCHKPIVKWRHTATGPKPILLDTLNPIKVLDTHNQLTTKYVCSHCFHNPYHRKKIQNELFTE